jgi:hypothetical protein
MTRLTVSVGIAIVCSAQAAFAQGFSQPYQYQQSTGNDMEQMLNFVDSAPGRWSAPPPQQMQQYQMQQYQMQQQRMQMQQQQQQQQQMQMQQQQGMMPRPSRRDLMRVFLEGGSVQSPGAQVPSGNMTNPGASSTAYSNYQRAANEASTARNYANKARYDKDKWIRKDSATRANYAANNANYAAQRAEAAAYNGDANARGYANMARAEANRARASADQARYNADTIR